MSGQGELDGTLGIIYNIFVRELAEVSQFGDNVLFCKTLHHYL